MQLLIAFVIFFILIIVNAQSDFNEICSSFSGRRIYLDDNGSGYIQAANITVSNLQNKIARIERMSDGSATIHYNCQLELITCASCVFEINITNAHFTTTCDESDSLCKCADYLSFTEPPYEDNSTVKTWCGKAPFVFRSRGRFVAVNYLYESGFNNPFNLTYVAKKNVLTYSAIVSENETAEDGMFQSPFFPNFYPRDLTVDHLIECISNDTTECHIEISFSDFQISPQSVMEFYDEDDQLVQRYTGEIFRPPIIRLPKNRIRVRFHGNGGTGVGYRANIRYNTQNFTDEEPTNTHCGGLVESFGGAITMMNMTNSTEKAFDCIWLIKPPNSYLHLKTHLLVRIDTFENMADDSSVILRDGSTSDAPLLKQYDWPVGVPSTESPFQSFVTTMSSGFYVSFKGVFTPESHFAIVYTAFSYMDCFPGPEFLCENHRCIPFFLQCDGFDHCGDGSDENERCAINEQAQTESKEYWLTHTPNYFFPKMDHYPDLKTAALVFLASAMSLIMLILLLIVILYRMNHHAREQRELQSQLRTISELLDNNANNQNEENEAALEEPPAYECPPDYEEASSLKLDMTHRCSSRVDTNRKRRRSRSRSRSHSRQYEQNSLLNMTSSTPTPSDILIPDLYLSDQVALASATDIECEISSRSLRKNSILMQRRSSESANVHSRRNSQVLLIPDSPPPEYTPRHIHLKESLEQSEQQYSINLPDEANDSINHMTLIINQDEHRLIDIQESPLIHSDHDMDQEYDQKLTLPLTALSRRHSYQGVRMNKNFFEQQFERHIQQIENDSKEVGNHLYDDTAIQIHPNALHWLRNCTIMHDKCLLYEPTAQRKLKSFLRKTYSENELLAVSQSNDDFPREFSTIRRSFSSSLLFSNCECNPIDIIQTGVSIC